MANRAEPPKLILISEGWAWTPVRKEIKNLKSYSAVYECISIYKHNSESTFLFILFLTK